MMVFVLLKGILPFVYCILTGSALALILKRSFIESLAPAFCTQIIMMMITGIVFKSVNLGIILGIGGVSQPLYGMQ